jgi:hypothetical protein
LVDKGTRNPSVALTGDWWFSRVSRPRSRAAGGFRGLFGRAYGRQVVFADFSAAVTGGWWFSRTFRPRLRAVGGFRGLFGRGYGR